MRIFLGFFLVFLLSSGLRAENSVLVIGDSHATSTFGKALDLLLRTLPDTQVTTVGSCGVTPQAFLDGTPSHCGVLEIARAEPDWIVKAQKGKTPQIEKLLSTWRPKLTVVELGANQIHRAYRDPEGAVAESRALAEAIRASGSRCLWVGPPGGREQEKPKHKMNFLYSVLKQGVADLCTFTDSRPSSLAFLDYERVTKSRRRKGDGRHFDAIGVVGQQMARRWALSVFRSARNMMDSKKIKSEPGLCKEPSPVEFESLKAKALIKASAPVKASVRVAGASPPPSR